MYTHEFNNTWRTGVTVCGGDNPQIPPVTVKTMGLNLGEFPHSENVDDEETGEVWGFSRHLFNTRTQFISRCQTFTFLSAWMWQQNLNKSPILKITNQQNNSNNAAKCERGDVWKILQQHLIKAKVKSGKWWEIKLIRPFLIKYYRHGNAQTRPAPAG